MEIELPDGTVLEAPDGADVKQVVMGYQRSRQAKQQYDPTAGTGAVQRTIEGIGSGMTRFGRGVGNLALRALPDPDNPMGHANVEEGPFSDAAVREQDRLDKPLSNTTAGAIGQGIGQTAASLPLSLGYGAASTAARALPLAGRVLSNPLVRGGIEGAVNSAAVADVDRQGKEAGVGAAIGTGLSAGFGAAGRLVRGLVQKSGAAQDLDRLATGAGKDIFVPVTQAANPEGDLVSQAASGLYKDVVPLIPFAPDQMKRQSARAMNTVREMALSQADPTGNVVQAGAGAAPQATISALKDAFNQEYENTAKNYLYDVPHDFRDQVETRIRAALPDVDDTTVNKVVSALDDQMDRFSSGKATIDGGNLLNAKNSTSEQMSKMRGVERSALNAGKGVFDDIISDELSPDVLARYQGLAAPYSAFKDVSKAANMAKSKSGNFTPAQLAIAAKAGSPLQDLAQAAQGTLGQPMYGSSLRGPAALAYGTYAPVRAASVLAGGNLLATETVQRAMMGDTAAQEAIQKLIEAHPESAAAIQTVIRNTATTQAGSALRPPE